jgi:hypothetical protein
MFGVPEDIGFRKRTAKMTTQTPTPEEVKELMLLAAGMVNYDPTTGAMLWKPKAATAADATRWNSRYANKPCGTLEPTGYVRLLFRFAKGRAFKVRAHRLAWFITHGALPVAEIDHINQDKADNRITNLRDVPKALNQRNGTRKGNNTSGVPGVTWHKQRGKWCAQCNLDGKRHYLGSYDSIIDAERATKKFRAEHGFTETHGNIRAAAAIQRAREAG